MKLRQLIVLLWVIAGHLAHAQVITFSKLPANRQLIPRNAQSVGVVAVEGQVRAYDYERVTVQVFREGVLYKQLNQPLVYPNNGTAPFSLSTTIPAELAQFQVRVFLHGGVPAGLTDSTLVADRQQIVAGDAYVISGQSNATAYNAPPYYTYQSDFIRTFGVYTGGEGYNAADTLWAVGNASSPTLVGTWGMEVARQLIEQYRVPICIINGAWGGAPIQLLNLRNEQNPMDLTTNYGRLLYRVDKAGLTGAIKAYFYRQGENETSGWATGWPANFDLLFQNVRRDYPNLGRFYLFQIHILAGTNAYTPVFRDYQRRLQSIQPLIRSHATVGTITYDGVHFGVEGHRQTGLEMFRLVARDFYGSTDTVQITSPDVRKVYYTSAARNEIAVQFEEGQQMRWPGDTTVKDPYDSLITHRLRQWLYLNGEPGNVVSGRADGHRVFLSLKGSRTEEQLGYLPPNYPEQESTLPTRPGFAAAFPGPFLKNERGLRAFSFWNVPIGAPLAPLASLTATTTNNRIVLSWIDHPAEQQYVLERRPPGSTAFSRVASLPANAVSFTDTTVLSYGLYQYRLRAVAATAEVFADVNVAYQCQTSGGARSLRSGGWQLAQTWQCGNVPTAASPATISLSHTIAVEQPVTARRLWLGGTLRLQPGGRVRLGQ